MKRLLSIINLLGVSLFCHGAEIAVTAVRQPGTSLDTSVRNEADNAKRLAADWLTARQNPDGSWGSTNANAVLTPIVWLALNGMDDAIDAVARDRAIVWLDSLPVAANAPFDAYLWRLLAILHALSDSPFETHIGDIMSVGEPFAADAPFYSQWLWREAVGRLCEVPAPRNQRVKKWLAAVAADYPLNTQNTETFWFFARLINSSEKGVWIRGTEALDWRNDFGLALINAQRKDPSGGGYWNAETDDAKLRATAFALLALREID
ncbi:MAG: hypothetical protein FWG50_01680 [Kiritimatiellaeota bacterium]|nr:hypothetical protein [Kiritimatiellota bacterium]